MITSVQSVSQGNLNTRQQPTANEQISMARKSTSEPTEWFCNKCNKYFAAPKANDNKTEQKIIYNCPYCGSADVFNSKAQCFREGLWIKA